MQKIIKMLRSSATFKKFNYLSMLFFMFAYCFSIPAFGSRNKWNYIVYVLMIILAILTFVYSFLYKRVKLNRWFLIIPVFVLFALIGTVLYSHMYRNYLTLLLLAVSFFVLYYCLAIVNNKRIILITLVSGLFIFSLYFIFHYRHDLLKLKNFLDGDVHLGKFFDNPNGVSAFAIIGYIMSLYSLLFIYKKYRWLFILPILTTLVVGIATGSRTFIVAFIVITLVITFFKYKKHLIIYFTVVGLFILLVVIMFSMPFMTTVKDKFIRIIWTFFTDSSRVDTSTISRITWLDYGFYLGNKHLFTGVGVYGFSVLSGVGTYTHSNFSEVWCDFGLPGFILFYTPMFLCVFKSFKNKNKNKSLILSVVIYYLLVSFSNVFYYTKFYYFNIAFLYYLTFNKDLNFEIDLNKKNKACIKKIVFTCDGMESGGAERVISVLSNEFVKQDYQVTIIGVSTLNTSSFYHIDERVSYITLHYGSKKKIGSLKRILLLRKQFKTLKPDIIISFLPHVNIYTYYASLGLKIPIIVSERNNPKTNPKGFFRRRLKKLAFDAANGVVFQTNEAKWCYKKSIRDKSTVIYNPINEKVLEILPSNKHKKVVLSAGRLVEQKNFKCLIDAFTMFSKNHTDYCLKIYGSGPLLNELQNYASNNGLVKKVFFESANEDWLKIEKDSSMFILSSDYEGMPNALVEAMSVGIPCISTDCPIGGPREIIDDGINGYLVKTNNPEAIANKMEELLIKPLVYDIKEFVTKFDVKNIVSLWLNYAKDVKEGHYEE